MVSIINEKRPLENGDSSLALSPPKHKMRRVSVVRDFPFACGPHPTLVNVHAKEAQGGRLKGVGDLSKDVDYGGEEGDDSLDVEGKGFLGAAVESHSQDTIVCSESSGKVTSSLVEYKYMKDGSLELPELRVALRSSSPPHELINKNPKLAQNLIQKMEEESMSIHKIHDRSEDLVEVRAGSLSALKNIGLVDLEKAHNDSDNEMIEGTGVQLHLLPHHPIPSCLVGREWKYPPPKTVSAVREFPSGCGCSVQQSGEDEDKHLGQDEADASSHKVAIRNNELQAGVNFDADIASKDKVKGITFGNIDDKHEGQSAEGACGVMIIASQDDKYFEMKGQEQDSEAKCNKQCGGLEEKAGYYGKEGGHVEDSRDGLNKEIVDCQEVQHKKETPIVVSCSNVDSQERMPCVQNEKERVIVLCLVSAPNCPWKRGREVKSSRSSTNAKRKKGKQQDYAKQDKFKHSPDKSEDIIHLGGSPTTIIPYLNESDTNKNPSVSQGEACSSEDEGLPNDFLLVPRKRDFDVSLPPFGAISSSERGVRGKVRETLRLFHAIVRKLQQGEETKTWDKEKALKRSDFHAARILKDQGKYINSGKKSILGPVPGIEVGDIFHFRIELAIVGLHRPLQSGIDTLNLGQTTVATSIVASGGYANDLGSSDVLIYTGQGGHASGDKQPEDQKLERGNLALKNSIKEKNVVRVIRGFKEKNLATYTYDGLYTVEKYWPEIGPHGKLVYKFELRRCSGQPELAWKEVSMSKNSKLREGRCMVDISGGKETVPICAVNTLDEEKPPSFTYITSMMYPDWCQPIPPRGCDCKDDCSDSERCACAVKNGGEIPYNYDGAIVEAKPLVYECGPLCKCRSTCHNRVSQYGIKFPLEIFKTESRGWGVRCLSSIPSGSFICEYIGELLDDKEAEQRAGSDEYLFDIGQNYNDAPSSSIDAVEDVGFTIDAAKYGNIGRFINHSCSPNLYAQNVVYDHEDIRIPHIMLFAAENIPPLQELTYHYNYAIDQVLDSNGNVKKKSCYCGSSECTGRMY